MQLFRDIGLQVPTLEMKATLASGFLRIFTCLLPMAGSIHGDEPMVSDGRFLQRLRCLNAILVDGRTPGGETVNRPVFYSFYVGQEEPFLLGKVDRNNLTPKKLKLSEVKGANVGNKLMMEFPSYYLLMDKDKSPICLIACNGRLVHMSAITRVGNDVYQNDPKDMWSSNHEMDFPSE